MLFFFFFHKVRKSVHNKIDYMASLREARCSTLAHFHILRRIHAADVLNKFPEYARRTHVPHSAVLLPLRAAPWPCKKADTFLLWQTFRRIGHTIRNPFTNSPIQSKIHISHTDINANYKHTATQSARTHLMIHNLLLLLACNKYTLRFDGERIEWLTL